MVATDSSKILSGRRSRQGARFLQHFKHWLLPHLQGAVYVHLFISCDSTKRSVAPRRWGRTQCLKFWRTFAHRRGFQPERLYWNYVNVYLTLRLLMSYIYIYIYDISSLRVNGLTPIMLTWRIRWTPNNASKWQMGFNSAFKGLKPWMITPACVYFSYTWAFFKTY